MDNFTSKSIFLLIVVLSINLIRALDYHYGDNSPIRDLWDDTEPAEAKLASGQKLTVSEVDLYALELISGISSKKAELIYNSLNTELKPIDSEIKLKERLLKAKGIGPKTVELLMQRIYVADSTPKKIVVHSVPKKIVTHSVPKKIVTHSVSKNIVAHSVSKNIVAHSVPEGENITKILPSGTKEATFDD